MTISSDGGITTPLATLGKPGTALISDSFDIATASGSMDFPPEFTQWILTDPLSVTAGTQYWVTFSSADPLSWNANENGAFGDDIYTGSPWQSTSATIGAISIQGSQNLAAPKPGTYGMLGCAIAAGATLLWRRRK